MLTWWEISLVWWCHLHMTSHYFSSVSDNHEWYLRKCERKHLCFSWNYMSGRQMITNKNASGQFRTQCHQLMYNSLNQKELDPGPCELCDRHPAINVTTSNILLMCLWTSAIQLHTLGKGSHLYYMCQTCVLFGCNSYISYTCRDDTYLLHM